MKKYSKVLVLVFAICSLFLITGCGSKKEDAKKDIAGTYEGKYTKFVGDDAKNEDEVFSLVLNEDGTGKNNRDGSSYDVDWSIDGENFKMTDKFGPLTIDYTGTLKDRVLQIYNGDPTNDFTVLYYYVKK